MSFLTRDFNLRAAWQDWCLSLGELLYPPVAVPCQAVPAFMPEIYRRLVKNCSAFDPARAGVQSPINQFARIPDHPFLDFLQSDPQRGKDLLRESKGAICEEQFSGMHRRDRVIADIVAQETLFQGGMSDADYALFGDFVTTCLPDRDFGDREARILDHGAALIAKMIAETGILSRLTPLDAPRDKRAMAEQFMLRLHFMQSMADCLAVAFGIPPIKVYFDRFPRRLHHAGGYALSRDFMAAIDDTPAVLIDASRTVFGNLPVMINMIGHEMRHQADFATGELFEQGLIGQQHPLFEHAALLHLNRQAYIRLPDIATPPAIRGKRRALSITQYIERGAYAFGTGLEQKLRPALPAADLDRRYELEKMLTYTMGY